MDQMEMVQRDFLDAERRWNADEKVDFNLLEIFGLSPKPRSCQPSGTERHSGAELPTSGWRQSQKYRVMARIGMLRSRTRTTSDYPLQLCVC